MVVLLTSTHYSVRTIRRFFETDQCSVMNVEQSWFHLNELSQAVPIKSTACVFYSPLIILDETIENDVAVPSCFAEILMYLLLDIRWDEARAVAILIIIGVAMFADEALTHMRLHTLGHVVIEDVHHALGKLHLLGFAE